MLLSRLKYWSAPLGLITVLLCTAALAFAQDAVPTLPIVPAPNSAQALAVALITTATPMLLALVKWLAPQIPKNIIPFAAPVVAAVTEILVNAVTGMGVSTTVAAFAGLTGVGLRELYSQLTQRMESVEDSKIRKGG